MSKQSVVALDGNILVCTVDNNLESWCLDSGERLARWQVRSHDIDKIVMSMDGQRVCIAASTKKGTWFPKGYCGDVDFEFIVFDTKNGQEVCRRAWQGIAFHGIACALKDENLFWTPSRTHILQMPLSTNS